MDLILCHFWPVTRAVDRRPFFLSHIFAHLMNYPFIASVVRWPLSSLLTPHMSSSVNTPSDTGISLLSHMAIPGSRNPFLTPQGRSHIDSPPHLMHPLWIEHPFASMFSSSLSNEDLPENLPMAHIPRHRNHTPSPNIYENSTIKEKTMAGVPPWPAMSRIC